jgi:hypothetical protein
VDPAPERVALPSGHLVSCVVRQLALAAAPQFCHLSASPQFCKFLLCGLMGRPVLHLTAHFRSADVGCSATASGRPWPPLPLLPNFRCKHPQLQWMSFDWVECGAAVPQHACP